MWKKILTMALCLLMLGAFVACDDSTPTVPSVPEDTTKGGIGVGGTTSSSFVPTEDNSIWLNIATYNIVRCENQLDRFKQTNVDNIVQVIKDNKIDICGLNEVDRNCSRSKGYDQPKYIAEKLTELTGEQYYWAFAAGLEGYHAPHDRNYAGTNGQALYGNAIVSKYPLKNVREVKISMKPTQLEGGYERRVILLADVEIREGEFMTVIASHFDLNADAREKAVDLIESELAGIKNPVVLMGDFNCSPNSNPIARLQTKLRNTSNGKQPTYPSTGPESEIDYIFISNSLQYKEHRVLGYLFSDHRPVTVKVLWP